jgi:hypothetical protein
VRFNLGPITYWAENPHAMLGAIWVLLALMLLALKGSRVLVRKLLLRRGWIHVSALASPPEAPPPARSAPASKGPATTASSV